MRLRIKRDISKLKVITKRKLPFSDAPAGITGRKILVTSKTPRSSIEHERGHYALGHSTTSYPLRAKSYIREEIQASLYAYNKVGNPRAIYHRLLGIFKDAIKTYKIQPRQALEYIKFYIRQDNIPLQWKRDYLKLVIAYKKAYK